MRVLALRCAHVIGTGRTLEKAREAGCDLLPAVGAAFASTVQEHDQRPAPVLAVARRQEHDVAMILVGDPDRLGEEAGAPRPGFPGAGAEGGSETMRLASARLVAVIAAA